VLMHALAASCEELRARTGNPPLSLVSMRSLAVVTCLSASLEES
jgi:hypothetical protein